MPSNQRIVDLSQFPERFRSKVLSTVVRNMRAGVAIRFGALEGETLPLTVQQTDFTSGGTLPTEELEQRARAAFSNLPYRLRIQVR